MNRRRVEPDDDLGQQHLDLRLDAGESGFDLGL